MQRPYLILNVQPAIISTTILPDTEIGYYHIIRLIESSVLPVALLVAFSAAYVHCVLLFREYRKSR